MGRCRGERKHRINHTIIEPDGRVAVMLNVGIAYYSIDGDSVKMVDHIPAKHTKHRFNLETFRLWLQDGI